MSLPKIAVLVNSPPSDQDFWTDIRASWTEAFGKVAPTATVDFYDPVIERKLPDATNYDLIVLSGGEADGSSSEPWVLDVLEYVRTAVRDIPKAKILGICWGHQAIARAFGGVVGPVSPVAAIQDISLTDAGKNFFPFAGNSYQAPEFHSLEVAKAAPGFIHLAVNHECFVNKANTVLTFQAHPEISNALAKKMLLNKNSVYNDNSSAAAIEQEVRKLDHPKEGLKLLDRVMQWMKE